MNTKRVGVLFGGPSSEHDVSLLSGINVMRALRGRYDVVPIFITQNGLWLFGESQELVSPGHALARVDTVFNALHGEYGEDGTVQRILEHHQIPYTGSEALASAISMNKEMSQKILESAGLRAPRSVVLGPANMDTRPVLTLSSPPWIVKPRSRGSSVGVSRVQNQDGLIEAFRKALSCDTHLIVQEFIPGREVTCGVLERFDGKENAVLAPIEIIPPDGADFFDHRVKYNGKTREVCPAEFYGAMLARIGETALRAHTALGLRHYSRTDMIIKPSSATRRAPEIYVLETNALPKLHNESLFLKAVKYSGLETSNFVDHLLNLAVS